MAGIGSSIQCAYCEHPNSDERKFCSQCGKPLWEKCPECNHLHAVNEAFCGSCGADLGAAFRNKREELQETIEQAIAWRKQHRYTDAAALLAPVVAIKDPRLAQFAEQATHLVKEIERERASTSENIQETFRNAKELTKNYVYEEVVGLLETIPEPLRTDEMTALLNVARARHSEVLTLTAKIREYLEAQNYEDLMQALERLLEILPGHQQARQMAKQVRDRLVNSAKKLARKHDYREASRILRELPMFVQTQETKDLLLQAKELAWLEDDLRSAPVVDKTLVAVADRLIKLAPTNERAKKFRESLERRLKHRQRDTRFPAPPWAEPPHRTTLGYPVNWLGGCRRILGWDQLKTTVHRERAGCFFVACGLAVQGLDMARIPLNLLPKEKTNLFARLSFSKRKSPTERSAWGLDFGGSSLKAVKLVVKDRAGQPDEKKRKKKSDEAALSGAELHVTQCEYIPYDRNLAHVSDVDEEKQLLQRAVEELLQRHEELKDREQAAKVCLSLRGPSVIGKYFFLPPIVEKRIYATLQYEVKNQIPIELDELCWDYHEVEQVTDDDDDEDGGNQRRIVVAAAREEFVRTRLSILSELEIPVHVVQSESLAIHNFICHEFFDDPADPDSGSDQDAMVILDVGSDTSNLVISCPDLVWFRAIGGSGNEFTKSLLQVMNLTFEQSEQIKQDPLSTGSPSRLYSIYNPILVRLLNEIERSLRAFSKDHSERKIERILGIGGGMHMHGLLRYLRSGVDSVAGTDLD